MFVWPFHVKHDRLPVAPPRVSGGGLVCLRALCGFT